jgi:hypothetical protein
MYYWYSHEVKFFIRFQKVYFHLPLHAVLNLDKLEEFKNEISKPRSIEKENLERVTTFGFDLFELGVENAPSSQNIIIRQKKMQVKITFFCKQRY